jgi:hypothetical protein
MLSLGGVVDHRGIQLFSSAFGDARDALYSNNSELLLPRRTLGGVEERNSNPIRV